MRRSTTVSHSDPNDTWRSVDVAFESRSARTHGANGYSPDKRPCIDWSGHLPRGRQAGSKAVASGWSVFRADVPWTEVAVKVAVVGLYPASQTMDFVAAHALAELSKRQRAANGPR